MADIYDAPQGSLPGEPKKKRNTTLIVILVIVALLLCCCCVLIWAGWEYGDYLLEWLGWNQFTLSPSLGSVL